jgi:hypothetical protein
MLDGGPGARPAGPLDAWLVTDEKAELIRAIRRAAEMRGATPRLDEFNASGLRISPKPVEHTSHPTVGYLIETRARRVGWAPEFFRFPAWAAGIDLLFADAAGWRWPIRFAHGVGGHAAALDVAEEARRRRVGRLVFAHVGRPTIRAIDAGESLPFGEMGVEGRRY